MRLLENQTACSSPLSNKPLQQLPFAFACGNQLATNANGSSGWHYSRSSRYSC
jgi:hypothetical protein